MRRLRILTWHTHGSYLYYLTQVPHDFLVLSKPERPPGYAGRSGQFAWGDNVLDLPAEAAARAQFDCILFQDDHHYLHDQYHYLHDQYRYLTPAQRRLAVIEAMLTGLPIVATCDHRDGNGRSQRRVGLLRHRTRHARCSHATAAG